MTSRVAPPSNSSSAQNSPPPTEKKRSILRRNTVGSAPINQQTGGTPRTKPSAAASARSNALAPINSPANNIAFSFGQSTAVSTASELEISNVVRSYNAQQRPTPTAAPSRSLSFSRLTSKFKSSGGFDSSGRNTVSSGNFAKMKNSASTTNIKDLKNFKKAGTEKMNPADFLPAEFAKKDWSLSHHYSLKIIGGKKVLGKGATAVVYLIHGNTSSPNNNNGNGGKQVYACKTYNKCTCNDDVYEHYSKIAEEYLIAHRLKHKNIVNTYDLLLDSNSAWCTIMDYCDQSDLFTLLESYKALGKKMPKEQRNCLFKQLLHGVNYMHTVGVAHRDIKPENLMINSKGELKISDFGVSVELFEPGKPVELDENGNRKVKLATGLSGSVPYIAPEVFLTKKERDENRGEGLYDARLVDVWACAITFINLVWNAGFFNKASITEDFGFARLMKELHKYWLQELDVAYMKLTAESTAFQGQWCGAEEATEDQLEEMERFANSELEKGTVDPKLLLRLERQVETLDQLVTEININEAKADCAKRQKDEDQKAQQDGRPSVAVEPSEGDTLEKQMAMRMESKCFKPNGKRRRVPRFADSYYHSLKSEALPLFIFNDQGDAVKRMLAMMLLPDPGTRPLIKEILMLPNVRNIKTCIESDPFDIAFNAENGINSAGTSRSGSRANSVSSTPVLAPIGSANSNPPTRTQTFEDFKRLKDANVEVRLKHSHAPPSKPTKAYGLGEFKNAPHEFY